MAAVRGGAQWLCSQRRASDRGGSVSVSYARVGSHGSCAGGTQRESSCSLALLDRLHTVALRLRSR